MENDGLEVLSRAERGPKAGRILVVDDAAQNVELLEAQLHAAGYDVAKAYNGEETLRKVKEAAPDLILLDLMMPGLDGYEVCRRLKADEETTSIPVMILTALGESEERIRAIGVGADDFLTKPFTNLELMVRVRSLLRLKRLHDQVEAYSQRAALGELAGGIAQEIRNPLAITSAAAQILLKKGADPELRRECAEKIRAAANRTATIIETLLRCSRPS
jgi:DNA-binding response OmpR family regulator